VQSLRRRREGADRLVSAQTRDGAAPCVAPFVRDLGEPHAKEGRVHGTTAASRGRSGAPSKRPRS